MLHAHTGGVLPDPLTCRSGAEEALDELTSASCSSFGSLNPEEIGLLHAIDKFTPRRTFYPETLRVQQRVSFALDIPIASQHSAFHKAVNRILDMHDTLGNIFRGEEHDMAGQTSRGYEVLLDQAHSKQLLSMHSGSALRPSELSVKHS